MRVLMFLLMALPGLAFADVSQMLRDTGLKATRDRLQNTSPRSPDDQLALGAVTFLSAVERAYHLRWRVGQTGGDLPFPVLRAPLPDNPAPEPFTAPLIRELFEQFLADMARAEAYLAALPTDADPSFVLSLPDLWFDVNGDGIRDETEGFREIALPSLMSRWQIRQLERDVKDNPDRIDPLQTTIRFDRSDLYWLRAYTQVLSGVSEIILAFDPTSEIEKLLEMREALALQTSQFQPSAKELADYKDHLRKSFPDESEAKIQARIDQTLREARADRSPESFGQAGLFVDMASVVIETLRHQPDPERIATARHHLLRMVQLNRQFWAALDTETDDDREWIPNARQTAALGFEMPDTIDTAWLAVLEDAEGVLKGELLIPFWRFGNGYGINLNAYVDNPGPLPIVQWIQGAAALPYAQQGEVMTTRNWQRFRRLVRRQTGLFVILLN